MQEEQKGELSFLLNNRLSFDVIKKRSEFLKLRKLDNKIVCKNFVVQYELSCDSKINVGYTATKKIGNAVKRNFAKRRLRACFYSHHQILNFGINLVLIARSNCINCDYKELDNEFVYALKRLKKCNNKL